MLCLNNDLDIKVEKNLKKIVSRVFEKLPNYKKIE
jgi:hypothetical protein